MEEIKQSLFNVESRKPISKKITHNITYNTKAGPKTKEYSQVITNTNKPRIIEIKTLRKNVLNYIKELSNEELINITKLIINNNDNNNTTE